MMLARIQAWLDKLQLDPEKTSLRRLFPVINVLLVLLVIIGIATSAIGLLRSLANDQGMTRAQLSGTSAREELRKISEDTLTQIRQAARNDSIRRAIIDNVPNALPSLLKRACEAGGFSACALTQEDQVIAQTDSGLKDKNLWNTIITAEREQGERFLLAPSDKLPPMMGAAAMTLNNMVTPSLSVRMLAVRFMDDRVADMLHDRVHTNIKIINYRSFNQAAVDDYTHVHTAALSDGRYAAERIDSRHVFVASVPVAASTGEFIALIQSEIPTTDSDALTSSLIQRLLITATIVGILAIGISVLVGSLFARPLQNLTDAATRLAQGDFSTSIPTTGPAEVGVLSRTMEDMRRNLVMLTGTLRRKEAEAEAVLENTTEGVFAVDKNRLITYINPQGTRLLGITRMQALGKFCGDVLKPCADAQGVKPCDSAICPIVQARNSNHATANERLHTGSGSIKTTVITSSGMVDGIQVQVIRDETEVESIRRARDSVLANISHEFRTPLSAQLASIELLLDGLNEYEPDQVRSLVMSLKRGAQRLTSLIDNLLESVRIESGQLTIRKQSVALHEVVQEAENLIGTLLVNRFQKLEIDVSPELPHIEGDEVRLTQVFVNLIANANKYAPDYSTIRVGAHLYGREIFAWVEDEGPGITDSSFHSIFERFTRGLSHEPEAGGLGLGLWIVKSIVERHGGTIEAERTAERRTRFVIKLPLPSVKLPEKFEQA
jgi:signal transduction histidine kinase